MYAVQEYGRFTRPWTLAGIGPGAGDRVEEGEDMASMPDRPNPYAGDQDTSPRPGRDVELDLLAARAGSGDRDALDRLLAVVRAPVIRYCRARLGGGGDAPSSDDSAAGSIPAAFL